ncbi:MAG: type II toxin-antitoxin system ParD family antitoxin [Novosphingobium sp.]
MTDLSFSLPSSLESRLRQRIAEGGYADAGAYLRDLVQRDLDEAADTAWVSQMIEEGEASGYIDRDARDVLREIVEERRAGRA